MLAFVQNGVADSIHVDAVDFQFYTVAASTVPSSSVWSIVVLVLITLAVGRRLLDPALSRS